MNATPELEAEVERICKAALWQPKRQHTNKYQPRK